MNNPVGLYIRLFCLTLLTFLFSCGGESDKRLEAISATVSEDPEGAMESLRAIDKDSLSVADRHFYDLLAIKAADKAYVTHTSDSLILDVIGYYSAHPLKDRYAEALYYGGRVYSDLGDYPTALGYFQKSLDRIESDGLEGTALYGNVLSQTARLLDRMRLYEEAVPYIEKVIKIDMEVKDTVNLVYDIQLKGTIERRAKLYEKSVASYKEAMSLSRNLPEKFMVRSRLGLASTFYDAGENDSALLYFRTLSGKSYPLIRNSILAYGASIYLKAGISDSANLFARELLYNDDPLNKLRAYYTILHPTQRKFIAPDSLDNYFSDYLGELEGYYDSNSAQLTITQNSLYNYSLHERERMKAQKKYIKILCWLAAASFCVLFLIIIILYIRNRSKKNVIRLHKTLYQVNRLKKTLNIQDEDLEELFEREDKEEKLRTGLRHELLRLYERGEKKEIPSQIKDSETYSELQSAIKAKRPLLETDPLWQRIEATVLTVSPDFKRNLELLSRKNLTKEDIHTALLIKCGITPTNMSFILGRSKSAIGSRRNSLAYKLFDQKLEVKIIDGIIRLL